MTFEILADNVADTNELRRENFGWNESGSPVVV